MMSCRTGPLRVGRPLRRECTALHGAPAGREQKDDFDQRENHAKL
jgi:hypothetical protein